MLIKKRYFLCCLLITLMVYVGKAQTPCTEVLKRAQDSYDAGHLARVPSLLEACLEKFNRRDKSTALRLITLSHLFRNNISEAEETMVALLTARPDYKVDFQTDPAEFINLYKKYRTDPIYSLGFKVGANSTWLRIIENRDVYEEVPDKFTLKPTFMIGFTFDRLIKPNLFANTGLNYKINKYVVGENPNENEKKEVTETQNWLELPLSVTYVYSERDIKPFVYGGASIMYLLSDKADNTIKPGSEVIPVPQERFIIDVNFIESKQHYRTNYSFFVGGGIKIKTGVHQTVVEMKYALGLSNVIKPAERYELQENVLRGYFVDDNYTINNFEITAGFRWNHYRIQKIK